LTHIYKHFTGNPLNMGGLRWMQATAKAQQFRKISSNNASFFSLYFLRWFWSNHSIL